MTADRVAKRIALIVGLCGVIGGALFVAAVILENDNQQENRRRADEWEAAHPGWITRGRDVAHPPTTDELLARIAGRAA